MRRGKNTHLRSSMAALSVVMGCLLATLLASWKSLTVGVRDVDTAFQTLSSYTLAQISRGAVFSNDLTKSTPENLSTALVASQRREGLSIKTTGIGTAERISTREDATAIEMSSQTPAKPSYDMPIPRVVSWKGWKQMHSIMLPFYFGGNRFCEEINRQKQTSISKTSNEHLIVNVSFDCLELFQRSDFGTGNYMSMLYTMRLASYAYENVELRLTCTDAEDSKKNLILPWLTGYFPSRVASIANGRNAIYTNLTIEQACGDYFHVPVAYMYKEIQYDLRKMAIGLVGIPSIDHPSAEFVKEYRISHEKTRSSQLRAMNADTLSQQKDGLLLDGRPLYAAPEFELDDAVIHFRCGDLMESKHPLYCFMTFSGYVRHISSKARSIGILTQPFEESAVNRKEDSNSRVRDRCRLTVMSLVKYIQQRHPLASVRIHNNPNETTALTHARMIMAKQAIVGISSFSSFPAIASFGTAYIQRPDYPEPPNKWLTNPPIDELADNVVLFDEPKIIMAPEIYDLWDYEGLEGVLKWFWHGEKGRPRRFRGA